MSAGCREFCVGSKTAARRVLRALSARTRTAKETSPPSRIVYYDTFDWLLHRADRELLLEQGNASRIASMNKLGGGTRHRQPLTEEPGFARDLPHGPVREAVEPLIGIRRLLPCVEIDAADEVLRILDDERKTVARVRLQTGRARNPGEVEGRRMPATLRAEPIRGYPGDFEDLTAFLEGEPELEPMDRSRLDLALAALGRRSRAYGAKLRIDLEPGMRAEAATRKILTHLLEVLEINEPGTRQDLDSEFLHDFRVAGRRTRSALTQIKGVLPPRAVAHFRREFSWLGRLTGPTRDLDVYLLTMPRYSAALPEHLRPDLEPLREFLVRHQRLEQRRLARSLSASRYQRLKEDWRRLVERPIADDEAPHASEPISSIASSRIWKACRRVLKRGGAITPRTGAEPLHRLRIDCKKLRYLLEFFQTLYPRGDLKLLIGELKLLQDNLGDFNDVEVQQVTLKRFAHQMVDEDLAPVETLMAMGRLVERLERRQVEERQRFHTRFDRFSAPKNRQLFRRLFKPA